MAELRPSETRGLSQSVLLHFEVFALQMLQFGSGRTCYMSFKWPSESRGLYYGGFDLCK
ncbi:hypothetical protein L208DRAFT_816859 [Tricholoma matsutake]|nr:hypothetical protein L208DRAFT_816859 [Tricholoma matsutake 945]